MFLGIEQQKFEQLNELNDSDYSISDSDGTDENESDSSIHEKPIPPKENSTKTPLRKSTRKKEVPFVGYLFLFSLSVLFICIYMCMFRCIRQKNIF